MLYVTGDTHGDWMSRLNTKNFPDQKELTKQDYVVILGDFGIWDGSKSENYRLNWLENKPFTTLFIDGNHENYDILDNMPVTGFAGGNVHTIRPSVLHLMRGQIFEIDNHTIFTFGGASSHDIRNGILDKNDPDFKHKRIQLNKNPYAQYRINHVSWWERELPNNEEMTTGIENLKRYENKVDYIFTHAPYNSLIKQLDGGSGIYKTDRLTDYLQTIKQIVDFKRWMCGHMHIEKPFYWERTICTYEKITRLW